MNIPAGSSRGTRVTRGTGCDAPLLLLLPGALVGFGVVAVLLVLGRRRRLEARAALVEHADALLDAAKRLLDVRAQAIEHRDRVFVGAATHLRGVAIGPR